MAISGEVDGVGHGAGDLLGGAADQVCAADSGSVDGEGLAEYIGVDAATNRPRRTRCCIRTTASYTSLDAATCTRS